MAGGNERLLLIDTCSAQGAVGLSEGGEVRAQVALEGRAASARIGSAVRELLEGAGWTLQELDGVGVVSGPGSFTGLRTGLAFAKGLCEAAELKLALVSRLAVLARAAGLQRGVAVLDAGRDGFYVRLQRAGEAVREWMCGREELLSVAAGMQVVVAEERSAEELMSLSPVLREISLADVVGPVRECLASGGSDVETSDANYVRHEADIYRKQPGTETTAEAR